jgi:hypothetical protein
MRVLFPLLLAATLGLGGCASMRAVDSDVTSFSQWPAGRKPATYVFERLPSQQARPEQQRWLEDAARPAVEAAGFMPAADGRAADVTVQIGARVTASESSLFHDPLWWRGGFYRPYPFGRGRYFGGAWGPRWGPGWGPYRDDYRYQREVALLIRDRASGQALYEGFAVNDGFTPMLETTVPAMFRAALQDFPNGSSTPRRVRVESKP